MSKASVKAETTVEEATTAPKANKARGKVKAAPKAASNGHAKPVKAAAKAVKAAAKPKGKPRAPRNFDPTKRDQFGFRLGSMKAQAAAIYAGKKGATLAEIKSKLDSTQFNLITELEGRGFKIKREEAPGEGSRTVTRYFILGK